MQIEFDNNQSVIANIVDPYGKCHSTWNMLFYTYRKPYVTISELRENGITLEEHMGFIPKLDLKVENCRIDENLTIVQCEYTEKMKEQGLPAGLYFTCIMNGAETIMNKTQILNYWRKIKGLSKFIINRKELEDIV